MQLHEISFLSICVQPETWATTASAPWLHTPSVTWPNWPRCKLRCFTSHTWRKVKEICAFLKPFFYDNWEIVINSSPWPSGKSGLCLALQVWIPVPAGLRQSTPSLPTLRVVSLIQMTYCVVCVSSVSFIKSFCNLRFMVLFLLTSQ